MKALRAPARVAGAALAVLGGCAAPERLPDPPASHPASAAADEAPERAPSQILVMPVRTPPANPGGAGRGH